MVTNKTIEGFGSPNEQERHKVGYKLPLYEASTSGFAAFENVLPLKVFDLLYGRLRHKSVLNIGANSFFFPFSNGNSRASETVIESVIRKYIVPILFGSEENAILNGFVGAEWWIQNRIDFDAKEYHVDTAITYCRDLGWPAEFLSNCHYYPAVGSVIYLNDHGGPTVIFDQWMASTGLHPLLPEAIALSFPKSNTMFLFPGNRYHGVLKSNQSNIRLTLLINYWKNQSAGERFSPGLPQEALYQKQLHQLMEEVDQHEYIEMPVVEYHVNRSFYEDLLEWQSQVLPSSYQNILSGFGSGKLLIPLKKSSISQYFIFSDSYTYEHWPRWQYSEAKAQFLIPILASSEDTVKWRRSLPGGYP